MIFTMLLLLQATPAPPPASEKPEREKVVCRSYQVTGSLIASRRVCLTGAQWKEQERDTQQMIDKIQQTSAQPAGK
ncbi:MULTISPECIES: hypothetical protein [unclassified Sphingomonas]|uniref:hypothetical protein n=1 Tax=unclassified Sphingomonas TaxID=196159 RepID=UPI001AD117DD|nr:MULTISPECIES: hypothetical protein [unclassified Sphingomonas]MBN8846841.1 hypothetical protein [Sphingomonas sp.]